MAKYYVSCGEIQEILVAQDAESAALEALQRFFEPDAWVFECPALSDSERRSHLAVEALTRLGVEVVVSQRGFRTPIGKVIIQPSGVDPEVFSMADMLDTYFRLNLAVARFAQVLEAGFPALEEQYEEQYEDDVEDALETCR